MEIVENKKGNYKVPLYIIEGSKPKILCEIIMEYHTAPMANCIEYVSKYSIGWNMDLISLQKFGKAEGSLHVLLSDFNDNNRVSYLEIEDYIDNYKDTVFYKMLEANNLVDFEIPYQKKIK